MLTSTIMNKRLSFHLNRLKERLWVKPLLFCILSIGAALLAQLTDNSPLAAWAPFIDPKSVESLLTVLSASMLVISTFAVASMVSAFAAASSTATPRSFSLVIADDVSQNALSAFIGAFIFSIVALVATKNTYYGNAGIFTIFVITLLVFAIVILTFLRWVDRIARLGRLSSTISKVEDATDQAMSRYLQNFQLAWEYTNQPPAGTPLFAPQVGYVQQVELKVLEALAQKHQLRLYINAPAGAFTSPDRPLLYISNLQDLPEQAIKEKLVDAFIIGSNRTFDEDPRFGLIALAEIASRALSPGINDPGTAIVIIGSLVRLFSKWLSTDYSSTISGFKNLKVAPLLFNDMLTDALLPIARDGASNLEVQTRLQKAYRSIAHLGNPQACLITEEHARQALERARLAMTLPQDFENLSRESKR